MGRAWADEVLIERWAWVIPLIEDEMGGVRRRLGRRDQTRLLRINDFRLLVEEVQYWVGGEGLGPGLRALCMLIPRFLYITKKYYGRQEWRAAESLLWNRSHAITAYMYWRAGPEEWRGLIRS